MKTNNLNDTERNKKAKGPIRFEAIIPVLVISVLTFIYFSFYFDYHIRKIVEYVGTQVNGAEVNIDSIRTSFIRGSFDMDRLQVTDKNQPKRNTIEIGNVHFSYLWDALLRMKFVVEEASINNVQIYSPRATPGKVVPPEPARPSKINQIQNEVMAQVKDEYSHNMLSDALALVGGGNIDDQIKSIRETLKSEARAQEMIAEVQSKRALWDEKITNLSDTSKLKTIEAEIQEISGQKDILKQAQGVQKLTTLLNEVNKQYQEIQKASSQLDSELKTVTNFPKELQSLIEKDTAALKSRFSIPELDFGEMAKHLFAGKFAGYIADARKYQALAEQYIPEKKQEKEPIIPRKRAEGENYEFPVTKGYPLFWLKRAAISSKGTAESYSGNVSGELTNVTTSPKQIKKPIVLDVQGDFPGVKVMGVKAILTADFTKEISKQSALIQVASFAVPEQIFIEDQKMKFGFKDASASSSISAQMENQQIKMDWISAINKPIFLVETKDKTVREMLTNILNDISIINIKGKVTGTFKDYKMDISSNLGSELAQGLNREVGAQISAAQSKVNSLVSEKLNAPKDELLKSLNMSEGNLAQLKKVENLYKDNEKRIQSEITKLKKGGGSKEVEDLKDKGKKLFKGIKL